MGFDDNRELDIEGARSALPIWTEFMKRALTVRRYSDAKEFEAPNGVVTVTIDPESGMPATAQCPVQHPEVFIAGTEPVGACPLHGGKGDRTTVSGWDIPTQPGMPPPLGPQPYIQPALPRRDNDGSLPSHITDERTPAADKPQEKKKGFFGKLKDVFK
ncbi:MAG: hypothetical protein M3N93_09670 [Acidobacteriota bacterium]|nr:hypothetical protein [Acidobacteriota bacterium]